MCCVKERKRRDQGKKRDGGFNVPYKKRISCTGWVQNITECARPATLCESLRIALARLDRRKKRETRCACILTLRVHTTTLVNFKLQMRKPINSIAVGNNDPCSTRYWETISFNNVSINREKRAFGVKLCVCVWQSNIFYRVMGLLS